MGLTKRVVVGRNSLSDLSVKAQKVIKQVIIKYGGVERVPITSKILTYVRGASRRYNDDLKLEKEASEKKQKFATQEVEASRIRKLVEAEDQKAWVENKNDLEVEIKAGPDFIAVQESIRHDDTEKALRLTNASAMKTSMYTAKFAAEATTE